MCVTNKKIGDSSSLSKQNRSEGNRVTRMLSYLMFQVNGEVRFKWLISHFVCKPEIRNHFFFSFLLKYGANTQDSRSKIGNNVMIRAEQLNFTDAKQIYCTYSPHNKGDAQDPSSSKVRVFKDGGVFCEGVVMDDGRLLVMEGLTKKPLLINEKHVTGWQRERWLPHFTLCCTFYR